jgi:hypothetical protein
MAPSRNGKCPKVRYNYLQVRFLVQKHAQLQSREMSEMLKNALERSTELFLITLTLAALAPSYVAVGILEIATFTKIVRKGSTNGGSQHTDSVIGDKAHVFSTTIEQSFLIGGDAA